MRELYVDVDEYSSCCAIHILHGFPTYEEGPVSGDELPCKKALKDNEWWYLLKEDARYPIYTFANSSIDNTGACTPAKLAAWLRRKGEKVYTGSSAVNPSTGSTITIYTWAPSEAFKMKLENYKNKKNKEDADNRGTRAA